MNVSELQNFQFGEPFWLLLLILIPLLLWIQKKEIEKHPKHSFFEYSICFKSEKTG